MSALADYELLFTVSIFCLFHYVHEVHSCLRNNADT